MKVKGIARIILVLGTVLTAIMAISFTIYFTYLAFSGITSGLGAFIASTVISVFISTVGSILLDDILGEFGKYIIEKTEKYLGHMNLIMAGFGTILGGILYYDLFKNPLLTETLSYTINPKYMGGLDSWSPYEFERTSKAEPDLRFAKALRGLIISIFSLVISAIPLMKNFAPETSMVFFFW